MADLYRKSSLERISSPEQLDKVLKVTSPMSWLALIGITIIIAVTVVWSVMGTIPVTITTKGIISYTNREVKIYDEDDSIGMARLKKLRKKNVEKFTVAVIDTIFSPKKLSKEDIMNMRYIPTTNNQAQFILEAGQITTESKIVIPVVECRAPYIMFLDTVTYRQEIINKIDDDVNNFNRYPGIKFGSMDAGNNEAGNWED